MSIFFDILVAWLAATGLIAILWIAYGAAMKMRGMRVITIIRAGSHSSPAQMAKLALWTQDTLFGGGRVVVIEDKPQEDAPRESDYGRVEVHTQEELFELIQNI